MRASSNIDEILSCMCPLIFATPRVTSANQSQSCSIPPMVTNKLIYIYGDRVRGSVHKLGSPTKEAVRSQIMLSALAAVAVATTQRLQTLLLS